MSSPFDLLGSTTLTAANATISVKGITVRKYLIILIYSLETATLIVDLRFNNDSGNNYAYRNSNNGAADTTTVSTSAIALNATSPVPSLFRIFVVNRSTQEKLVILHHIDQNTAGAANAPNRDETVGKWANTSAQITEVDVVASTSTFASGTTLAVYGSD